MTMPQPRPQPKTTRALYKPPYKRFGNVIPDVDMRTSVGIILLHRNAAGGRSYLLGKRRDSFCYVDFMRGYIDRRYIRNYIAGMTLTEQNRLLHLTFVSLWEDLWVHHHGKPFIRDRKYAGRRFSENMSMFRHMIRASRNHAKSTGWVMPKGRRRAREKDLHCGIREFYEESAYPTPPSKLRVLAHQQAEAASQPVRLSRAHTAFTGIRYETVYYGLETDTPQTPAFTIPASSLREACVSDELELCKWMELEDACEALGRDSVYASMLREMDGLLAGDNPPVPEEIVYEYTPRACHDSAASSSSSYNRVVIPCISMSDNGWVVE